MYDHFSKFLAVWYIVDFVNKTTCDKGGACANENRKQCNEIAPDRTLGRNDLSAGYVFQSKQFIL